MQTLLSANQNARTILVILQKTMITNYSLYERLICLGNNMSSSDIWYK